MRVVRVLFSLTFFFVATLAGALETWTGSANGPAGGVVRTASGAITAIGRHVLHVTDDGRVDWSRDYPVQALRIAAAGDGFAFAAVENPPIIPSETLIVGASAADGNVRWVKRIGIAKVQDIRIAGFKDGSVCVGARHEASVLLIRFTREGNVRWQRVVDYSDYDDLNALIAMRDDSITAFGSTGALVWGVRLNADGDVVWQRVFASGPAGALIHGGTELPNGDLAICGSFRHDVLYGRIARDGDVLWLKTAGGTGGDVAVAVAALPEDRVAILAATDSFSHPGRAWLLVIDEHGNLIRQEVFGNATNLFEGAATAANGNGLWLAFSSGGDTMLSRVDSDAMCGATRTEERARVVSLSPEANNSELTEASLDAKDFPFVLAAAHIDLNVERCASAKETGSDTNASPTNAGAAAAGADDEDANAFANRVEVMFEARKFRELDELAAKLIRDKATFRNGVWKIKPFTWAFDLRFQERLRILGPDRVSDLLNDWYNTTKSATSRLARAQFLISRAWEARGYGYSNTVIENAARKYEADITASIDILNRLRAEHACNVRCFDLLIAAQNLGGWSAPLRESLKKDPMYWHSIESAAMFLRPEWGGTPAEALSFAVEVANATRATWGDAAYMKVIVALSGSSVGVKYDWKQLKKGFEDFQKRYPQSVENADLFMRFAYGAGDREAARSILRQFPSLALPDVIRQWAQQPTDKPIAPSAQVIERTILTAADGVEHPMVFAVKDNDTVVFISASAHTPARLEMVNGKLTVPPAAIQKWTDEDGRAIADRVSMVTQPPYSRTVVFEPGASLKLTPLSISRTQPAFFLQWRILTCGTGQRCVPTPMPFTLSSGSEGFFSFKPVVATNLAQLIGAPVIDAEGAVMGVVYKVNEQGNTVEMESIERVLRLPRTPVPFQP